MAKPAKGKQKSAATAFPSKPKAGSPPAPFVFPDTKLQPFLEWLNPKHIYITHIDSHPTNFKLQLFCVPLFMNMVIIVLLAYRAQQIFPYYVDLCKTMWGHQTEYYIDVKNTGWNVIMDEMVRRTLTFMLDLFLVRFVGAWPYDFLFARPASACAWRMALGFQVQEIAVRRSRRWDQTLKKGWITEDADKGVYKERIMPAIERRWIREKSAYMMMDKNWDLDFHCMIQAHYLVTEKKLSLDDFQKQVWVYHDDYGWLVWPVWRLDEGAEDEGRKKIVAMKDRLTAMGKENLFFRWIELIQFESSQPGGFNAERQQEAMRKAKDMFEEQGVDFDQFWKDVGGMENMPGMETKK
jgi:hypothetical protein